MSPLALDLVERGLVPDSIVRAGIRRLLRDRLDDDVPAGDRARREALEHVVEAMDASPVAVATDVANEQHYEVPASFYELVLGPHLKYSGCLWPEGVETLGEAEAAMLALTCERADLRDGQRVLELGCGWGSLTLWMAERYPASSVTAVSNSGSQRAFIEARARERGLGNVRVVTADVNDFRPGECVDRVVSVEMFEHVRNWRELLGRVATWLEEDGRLFLHVFCHRDVPYFFEDEGEGDWMARHFFTGGLMPSLALPDHVTDALETEARWEVGGVHYARTARAWLDRMDARREEVEAVFRDAYGPGSAGVWVRRWRLFFMACEELFGYRGGEEWLVAHTRMRPVAAA